MVLGDCLASGYPEFMRASQALLHDGRALVFEKGTYRMWFGPGVEDNGEEPPRHLFLRIKNFDVTVDVRMHYYVLDDVLMSLGLVGMGRREEGRKCEMRFLTACALELASEPKVRELMGCFRGFEVVVVRVEIDKAFDELEAAISAGSVEACCCDRWERENNDMYGKVLGRFLEPILGKVEIVREEGRYCLVYHPGENAKASKALAEG